MPEPTYHLATVRGQADVLVWGPDGGDWYMTSERIADGGWCGHPAKFVTNLRPVVLLDPAALSDPRYGRPRYLRDAAQNTRTEQPNSVTVQARADFLDHLADLIEAQTTPPVAEPTDGSTVRDFRDVEWARSRVDGRWCSLRASGNTMPWDELVHRRSPLTVLSEERVQ